MKFLKLLLGFGVMNALYLATTSTQDKQIIALAGVAFYLFLAFYKMPIGVFVLLTVLGFTASLGLNLMMFLSSTGCFFCFINLVIITIVMLIGFMQSKLSKLLKAGIIIAILLFTWVSLVLVNDPMTKMAFNIPKTKSLIKGDCPCDKKGAVNATQ